MNEFLKLVYEPRLTDTKHQLRQNIHNILVLLETNMSLTDRKQLGLHLDQSEKKLKALEN